MNIYLSSSSFRHVSRWLRLAIILLVAVLVHQSALLAVDDGSVTPSGYPTALGFQNAQGQPSAPLRIWTDDHLRMLAYRDSGNGYVQQYFSTYETTLRLGAGQICGNHQSTTGLTFVPVSHVKLDANNVQTAITTGDNVSVVHTVSYTQGDEIVRHQWVVTNNGSTNYSNVALRYGGDSYFAGDDAAVGYYDGNIGMVYCTNPGLAGLMGMFGAPTSPASGYYEAGYSAVWNALRSDGDLANLSPSVLTIPNPNQPGALQSYDNGMGMEWIQANFLPGATFTVIAYEKWTLSGNLQVIAPPPSTHAPGAAFTLTFTVQNLQATPDTVELLATGPVGWVITAPATITIPAQSSGTVDVQVTIPSNATTSGQVLLQVTSRDPQTQAPRSVQTDRVTITVQGATVPPGPVVTVQSPSVQLSRGDQTIYTPISPSTPEGITSILSALAGQSNTMTRAFAFDSYMGSYVELPLAAPMGGVLRTTGIFLATRQALNYSLSGTPATMPAALTVITGSQNGQGSLNTGWAFAGVPPVEVAPDQYQTSYTWGGTSTAAILQVIYQNSVIDEFSTPSLMDLMGTVGSTDVSTARPWWWNGSSYEQVTTLESGKAYWFKNNSLNSDITIQVVTSSVVNALALRREVSEAAPAKAKPIRLHDQGAPPPPPSASTTKASSSSKGGCGTGSGLASLALLMFMVSLRFLIRARR